MTSKKLKNGLTEKQEAACQAYIECGGNQSKAYRRVYNCENSKPETVWNDSCKLFSLPHISARVIELQEISLERHFVTVDTITKELDESREMARGLEKPEAMTTATMSKAKIHGLVTDKQETKASFTITIPSIDANTL